MSTEVVSKRFIVVQADANPETWLVVDTSATPQAVMFDTSNRLLAYKRAKNLNEYPPEHPPEQSEQPTSEVSEVLAMSAMSVVEVASVEPESEETIRDRKIYEITVDGDLSVSSRIRKLHDLGLSTGDVAKRLGIRYQQAHNVINRSTVPGVITCKVCRKPLAECACGASIGRGR